MPSRFEGSPWRGPIRITIFADTGPRAQAIAALLAEDERLEILSVGGAAGFKESAADEAPDVMVAVALSFGQLPQLACPVVVASDAPARDFLVNGKVHAWLPLDCSVAELSAAILAAACDLTIVTRKQLRRWLQGSGEDAEPADFLEKLTARELQVLRMLADGLGNKEIAGQLGLSNHTAKFHVAQILAKLRVSSRTEAVTIGIRRGLVPI